jgi:hypothetical protein
VVAAALALTQRLRAQAVRPEPLPA